MMAKDKGISLFDFSLVIGFIISSGLPLCKASILFIQKAQDGFWLIRTEVLTLKTFPELHSVEEIQN